MKAWLSMAAVALSIVTAVAADPAVSTPPITPRYTFSYPLERDALPPRGGITHGPSMAIEHAPTRGWRELTAPGLSKVERDRRAILAMVGTYRVSFDFLEVANFAVDAAGKPDRPYQSWGTERVYLDRDDGKVISLVHLLEMRIVQDDGALSEPLITKHWRQDWRFEPTRLVEYRGNDQWQGRSVARAQRTGRWSQTVVQVDESPRYASLGRWQHTASFSTWISAETWRPLPRREWSVRKDYQVLAGTNRITITATGWTQEENNLKLVLTAARKPDIAHPYRGREYGLARYETLAQPDFAAADEYYQRTRQFWGQVHDAWEVRFAGDAAVTLRAPVDQSGSFQRLFSYAEDIAAGKPPSQPPAEAIKESMHAQGAG